ncbi:MAG: hypothetical protein AAGC55_27885 [Myxococcota bacterium]
MNRRMATLIGSIIAALAAGEMVVLSGLLAAERQGDRDRYQEAMTRQRRAAGHLARVAADKSSPTPPTRFCVRGVNTFVTTAKQQLQRELLDGGGRLDVSELRALSQLAVRAERYVELASAGPALPQRMGRTRIPPPEPDSAATTAPGAAADRVQPMPWRPLIPPTVACADSEAYATFRLDLTEPAPATTP